ncbi:aa3-type cytochrome c oxidase subunit IV [Sphingomonas sp.]|nr:aa3-type cytochrome c oxidase subunit IV [Sphingomonas sp.]MBX3595804.1 aa3-type cytochrome c oxidase subunit IV [Sphingomonas sp.]
MAQSGEMKAHENTYGGFLRLLKVGTIISALVGALAIWLIAG